MITNNSPEDYVLIVDDEPDALEILDHIVHALGIRTRAASDGLEALDVLKYEGNNLPSLVLLDIMMPGLDGFGVLRKLRGNPVTRNVPVIVVTACDRSQLDSLRLPGVAQVVQKGQFTVVGLMELVANILEIKLPDGKNLQ